MSKAFTKETDSADDDEGLALPPLPPGGKNYITPSGYARLRAELLDLIGIDEADSRMGQVSWISPVARALLKARVGDEVQLPAPGGVRHLEVVEVQYPPRSVAR